MSVQTFPVSPGVVTPLTGALAAGAVIINTDAAVAVWISDDPGVAPGHGIRLGPKGSTTWSTAGAGVYACLDAGATAPVVVTISTDISAVDNPVDIGVAVATQLLAQGVPSVLTGTSLIVNGTVLPQNLDVSGYASLNFAAYISTPGPFVITFTDKSGGSLATYNVNAGKAFDFIYITIPVSGPLLDINFNFGGVCSLIHLYGSNRAAAFAVTNRTPSAQFSKNQAWTVGQNQSMGWFTSDGGPVWCRYLVTGTGKGYFAYYDYSQGGGPILMRVQDTTSLVAGPVGAPEVYGAFYLPPGMYELVFQSQIAATYQALWELTQP